MQAALNRALDSSSLRFDAWQSDEGNHEMLRVAVGASSVRKKSLLAIVTLHPSWLPQSGGASVAGLGILLTTVT